MVVTDVGATAVANNSKTMSVDWDPHNALNLLLFYESTNGNVSILYGLFEAANNVKWKDVSKDILYDTASGIQFSAPFTTCVLPSCGDDAASNSLTYATRTSKTCLIAMFFDWHTRLSISSAIADPLQKFDSSESGEYLSFCSGRRLIKSGLATLMIDKPSDLHAASTDPQYSSHPQIPLSTAASDVIQNSDIALVVMPNANGSRIVHLAWVNDTQFTIDTIDAKPHLPIVPASMSLFPYSRFSIANSTQHPGLLVYHQVDLNTIAELYYNRPSEKWVSKSITMSAM